MKIQPSRTIKFHYVLANPFASHSMVLERTLKAGAFLTELSFKTVGFSQCTPTPRTIPLTFYLL